MVSARAALDDAKAEAATKRAEFCSASTGYITALDRYGDILNETAPTVGDVKTAGRDLAQPGQDAVASGQAAADATRAVTTAEQELAAAEAELAVVRAAATGTAPPSQSPSSTTPGTTSTSTAPAVPNETIVRVQQAESEFETAQGSISDDTALRVASQQFNAAAVALELAWLGLYAEAGCLTDPQQQKAVKAVQDYTKALQQDLLDAGYYSGKVDGVYGPTTVAAVEALQKAHGLPVTGAMDKATEAGLRTDLAAKGGVAAGARGGLDRCSAADAQARGLLGRAGGRSVDPGAHRRAQAGPDRAGRARLRERRRGDHRSRREGPRRGRADSDGDAHGDHDDDGCAESAALADSALDRLGHRGHCGDARASDGNRTRVSSLGSWRSTIELRSHGPPGSPRKGAARRHAAPV